MKHSSFTGTKRAIVRVIIAFFCLSVAVYQVYQGCRMLQESDNTVPYVTSANYDDLKEGDIIRGEISDILTMFYADKETGETPTNVYFSLSDTGHFMAFRTLPNSTMDLKLSNLLTNKGDPVMFKGKVKKMTDSYYEFLKRELWVRRIQKKIDFDLPAKEALPGLYIDAAEYDAAYSQKVIIVTFVGAGLMVILAGLFLAKLFKNAYISIAAEKGKYHAEMKVTKDDLKFEMEGNYEGNEKYGEEFFVNTEYNIREYGVNKNESKADKRQLPSTKDDPALNRDENDQPLFYTDSKVNDEGNFYVDSKRESGSTFDDDSLTKKY